MQVDSAIIWKALAIAFVLGSAHSRLGQIEDRLSKIEDSLSINYRAFQAAPYLPPTPRVVARNI